MNDIHGEVGIDVERLRAADPNGLYLFMLEDYPYMMISAQVAVCPNRVWSHLERISDNSIHSSP